jgi:hypothetical protein
MGLLSVAAGMTRMFINYRTIEITSQDRKGHFVTHAVFQLPSAYKKVTFAVSFPSYGEFSVSSGLDTVELFLFCSLRRLAFGKQCKRSEGTVA